MELVVTVDVVDWPKREAPPDDTAAVPNIEVEEEDGAGCPKKDPEEEEDGWPNMDPEEVDAGAAAVVG